MAAQSRKNLPVWSKVVIALVVISMGGVFSSTVSFLMFMRSLAKNSVDPECMRSTAQMIANFPDPLPPGYHYTFCLPGQPWVNMVTVQHDNDKQIISLFCANVAVDEDSKDLVVKAYSYGINPLAANPTSDELQQVIKFREVKSRGQETVGGRKMDYIVGEMAQPDESLSSESTAADGKSQGAAPQKPKKFGMVGCINDKDARKLILVYSLQVTDRPYNHQVSTDLLNSIKGL